jgi:hypothetical protein
MKTLLFIISALLTSCVFTFAQTLSINDTLQWQVSSVRDLNYNQDIANNSVFVTTGISTIDWIQNDGSYTLTFTVESTAGQWDNVSTDGYREYQVIFNNTKQGSMRFSRAENTTTISLNFPENGVNTMPFTFTIANIEKK